MKDLLFRLPQRAESDQLSFTANEWAEIELYLDAPVKDDERARLVEELGATLKNDRERELIDDMLNELVRADGELTPAEAIVLQEVQTALEHVDNTLIGQLSRLLSGPRQRRNRALENTPNRERFSRRFHQQQSLLRPASAVGDGRRPATFDRRCQGPTTLCIRRVAGARCPRRLGGD